MEKFSKEHNDFFSAILESEPTVEINSEPSFAEVGFSHGLTEDMNPIVLKNFLVDKYGIDWLDWLPEVLNKTLFEDKEPGALSDKIQAIRICLTTDTPWLEWHIFENIGKAFNHQIPSFEVLQPLTVGECITTMDTMIKLRDDEEFSSEVLSYVASIAANSEYVHLPLALHVGKAQSFLDSLIHDSELSYKTQLAWEKIKDKDILNAKFSDDDSVHRQLAKLALAQQYYREFLA